MKESGHVFLYIADFVSLISRIGDWGERAYIHFNRRGLASKLLDKLASHPEAFDSLQELMDFTLKLDKIYHERQKEKVGNHEKEPPVTGSNSSRPPQDSSSRRPHHKKNKKCKQVQASKDKPHSVLLNKENKLIGSEMQRRIKEGLCTFCGGKNPIEKCFKRPQNKSGSSKGFPSKQGKVSLKTPSLPSSVHITPIIPSQSLLQLGDEVFKEIKDVGEDFGISSLHPFQGDMDLLPLSFHASLDGQWDEEEEPEEIETVLKLVPPAYHQYLDVFSKVKAEKLHPLCACDNHIKLEGLLPPICVIYFLLNQESE
ncbi:hypothetical protein O181_028107 [Austropuccinia psidii MF-1]|uniref:Uncharacterized protein n=1 Tax=Austropuccinia psidii MF-1 TaxID=1389203 RepID=A0A9Q3CR85_9BASI|nr:hypothetical protein [Austropuccinia psidii MF-1]